jgi:PhnB protein
MNADYKPQGYSSVSPYLIVNDAGGTIDFLTKTFDAVQLRRILDAEGKVRHAEVRIDDSVVMLADAVPGWPAVQAAVHIYVPDVDVTYARALEAGAVSVQAPVKKDDADRRGGVQDAGGTIWWIATQQE